MERRTVLKGVSLALVGGATMATAQPKRDTLRWASTTSITAIDPYYNFFRESAIVIAQMAWDTLILRDPDTGEYKPLLAKSWRWVNDTTVDFELRSDVKWHDGLPLTADDAVYTINYVSDASKKVNVQSNVNWMKNAEKTGPLSFRLYLKSAFPAASEYLAGLVPIMPKDFYGPSGAAGGNGRLVGTGPYRIAKFTPGASVELERFDGYFSGSPKGVGQIKYINYRTIPDMATQMAEVLGGGVDWIWNLPSDQAKRLAATSRVNVVASESMRFSYLAFNTRSMGGPNPVQSRKVREAIACAVDREAIVKHIIGEGSSVVRSACYRSQFGCKQDVLQYAYDPAKAKRLLAEAGYAGGLTLELGAYRSREWTEAVASYLAAVGIKTNVTFQEYGAVHKRVTDNQSIHMFLADWGAYSINDAGVTLNNFFTLSPDDMAQDPTVAKLVGDASRTNDQNARKASFAQALDRIADEVYWLPLWVHPTLYAYAKGLAFKLYPDENPRLYSVKWS